MTYIVRSSFFLILFTLPFLSQAGDINKNKKDTVSKKIAFHVYSSTRPFVNWVHQIDTAGNFFNSPSQFEGQVSYKRHNIGLGFSYQWDYQEGSNVAIPDQYFKTISSFTPYYLYNISTNGRWKIFAGGGFMMKARKTESYLWTSIEKISEIYITREKAVVLMSRVNYRINKRVSLELESAYYFSAIKNSYRKDYPLTPSLGVYTENNRRANRFSTPSNLFLKFSF